MPYVSNSGWYGAAHVGDMNVNTTRTYNAAGDTGGPEPQPGLSAELLDVRSVAARLGGCSTRHVYRLADAGRMPRPIKLGSGSRQRNPWPNT